MPKLKTWQLTAGSAVAGLALAAGAVAVSGPWDSGQRKAERDVAAAHDRTGGAHHEMPSRNPAEPAPAPSARSVLGTLGAPAVPPSKADRVKGALAPLFDAAALGRLRTASVVDATTGEPLFTRGERDAMTPASTVKIATAVAALSALGPDHRIPTTVLATADGTGVVLKGGGDPTLEKEGLRALAADTARALRDKGAGPVSLSYDTTLYTGPDIHPIGRNNENLARVTPLMVNEGRIDGTRSGIGDRSPDPAGDAARAFAAELRALGVGLTGDPSSAKAPADAEPVAKTLSAPLSALVERTLTHSDNDIAEALARQTAIAAGEEVSFAGAGKAVHDRLAGLDLPAADALTGARFADGSGLDRNDRVSASLLTALLTRAADPAHPELRPVLTGLPVAGFSGTLSTRYAADAPGTGLVRAKTGTLNGINTLAGTVVTQDGRLVAFAFLAGGTPARDPAQDALDALASKLAATG
ncbi:D-alanyl-D-alanine carboxypeptidase/D-alanyl-D-alanine endopeptidase [Streptomyces candidus]|uniref:D-alanyl-D-alanine carboxypeptidase/D-alanyl-D-alanine-endopeptidase (Penicillin-binding protein 4) n=1 Tax=Streptomyces candidus TaxID=67283 RepID=A0A7X0LRC8_9ACTN|nr:D-alanyl-D-alanine carboxypeptidase/D-alanyl-D-alanine-endopeptidase [Streptomyces candidus]MBB6438000.1 D-alanyl-D-alanine carboxypeptidase/D-alanyl-D-alanine-endopeptidase (penicillin-binding protein 4) [Streptomyces candidus]GHH39685.1 D-alanyl-D-alanine carboxypeptidase [Streptomyces candidus]